MSTPFPSLLLAAGLLLGACGPDTPPLPPDFQSYLAVQQALADDDYAAAKKALQQLVPLLDPDIKPLAQNAVQAQDIAAMRSAFRLLSGRITDRAAPAGLVLAYCPMVEGDKVGYWFQREGDIKNPYFGASMLNCGGFPDSKAGVEGTP